MPNKWIETINKQNNIANERSSDLFLDFLENQPPHWPTLSFHYPIFPKHSFSILKSLSPPSFILFIQICFPTFAMFKPFVPDASEASSVYGSECTLSMI